MAELAHLLNCRLVGDPNHLIEDVSDLESAQPTSLCFFAVERYLNALKKTKAGAVITKRLPADMAGMNFLLHIEPSQAFEKALALFRSPIKSGFQGVHSTAVIHESATIGRDVQVGPQCTVDRDVKIGESTVLMAGVHIGAESTVGANCHIYPNVVIREGCKVGNRVVIQPSAVVGSCGFGFSSSELGHEKEIQWGGVQIEDDVEVGALTAIDRARFAMTVIGTGTKIDNLVQIAHSVKIGPHNLIAAQAGLAGSSSTGSWVIMAGQSAVTGHRHIGAKITLTARAGATKDLLQPGIFAGFPTTRLEDWRRQIVHLKKLPALFAQVQSLQDRLER